MARMEIIRDNALHAVEQLEADLGRATVPERERLLFDLSPWYRKAAVAALLGAADAAEFRRALAKSGRARRELLGIPSRAHRPPGRFQCASHTEPLFDAMVSGEDALALEIAALSPERWIEGEEWEEDFAYAAALHALLRFGRGSPEAARAAGELERAEEGQGPRVALVRALLAADPEAFGPAFAELLAAREAEIAEASKELQPDPELHAVERHVYVEGLALAWLAETLGLPVPGGLPMLPDLARRTTARR